MTAPKAFYVTTPIYYVNDVPHIGHAYTTLACDVLARFKRLDGYDVMFLTGTDEHGQKVEKAAALAGVTPQAFTDRVSQNFRDLCQTMNYTNDQFIRTTEPRHAAACQDLWKKLEASGNIYLGSYSGWYAVRDEAFYGEDELTEGPNGKKIAPTGAEVEWVEEPSYFFKLSAWAEPLLKFYEDNPDFIAPVARRNEVVSFVKGGLHDLSISRTTFDWGVQVPGDEKHVMYVWLDALTNYMTAVGYPDTGNEAYRRYWPADLHMIGKEDGRSLRRGIVDTAMETLVLQNGMRAPAEAGRHARLGRVDRIAEMEAAPRIGSHDRFGLGKREDVTDCRKLGSGIACMGRKDAEGNQERRGHRNERLAKRIPVSSFHRRSNFFFAARLRCGPLLQGNIKTCLL